MTKRVISIAFVLLIFLLGVLATRWFYKKFETVREEQATVLLERVRSVAKLVTVEGQFSEIYDYKDYDYGYDISPFRKKALIRVKATVSVGYNLEKLKIEAIPSEKKIIVSNMPNPEVLAIEHDLDYYDLQEGIFNSFSTEDYNRLNANAKEFIRKKALESNLIRMASEQKNILIETMQYITESTGWRFEVAGQQPSPVDSNKG
jgi:hypothetical protein